MSELFEPFLRHIRHDLAGTLPGKEAQMGMAPLFRARGGESYDTVRPDARQGGVLALFYPQRDQLFIPLILRPTYTGVHSGQVGAFEGAAYEATGYYRSQTDCTMFTRDAVPFCAACQVAIRRVIALYAR